MLGLQTVLSRINRAFGTDQIAQVATDREAYAPGKPLGPPQIAIPKDFGSLSALVGICEASASEHTGGNAVYHLPGAIE